MKKILVATFLIMMTLMIGINTKAYTIPSIEVNTTVGYHSISYTVIETDPDNRGYIQFVELTEGTTSLGIKTSNSGTYSGLTQDTTYDLEVVYYYTDSGGQTQSIVENIELTTNAYVFPSISDNITTSYHTITYDLTENDPDDRGFIDSVRLYDGFTSTNLLETQDNSSGTDNINGIFENLEADSLYRLEVDYFYNMDEGQNSSGLDSFTESYYLSTEAYITPQIDDTTLDITSDYHSISVYAIEDDPDNRGYIAFVELKQGSTVIENINISSGGLNETFSGLNEDTNYTVNITYFFNMTGDGENAPSQELDSFTETYNISTLAYTHPTLNSPTITSDYTSVSVDITENDPDDRGYIAYVNILTETNTLIDGVSGGTGQVTTTFTGLNQNTTYKIEVGYLYNMNVGETAPSQDMESFIETYTISTNAYIFPSISLDTSTDNTSVSYQITETDPDNRGYVYLVELYEGTNLIDTSVNLTDTFSGLTQDTSYRLEIIYYYNMNDGETAPTYTMDSFTETEGVVTNAYIQGSVEVLAFNVFYDYVFYNFTEDDPDDRGFIYLVELYQGTTLVNSKSFQTSTFTGLTPDTTYRMDVVYYYNMDLGQNAPLNTMDSYVESITFTTEAYTFPEIDTTNSTISSTYDSISMNFVELDPDNRGYIAFVELYEGVNLVDDYVVNNNSFNTTFTGLNQGTEYTIDIIYFYNMNVGETAPSNEMESFTETFTISTNAYINPSIVVGFNVDETFISYNVVEDDPDNRGFVYFVEVLLEETGALIGVYSPTTDKIEGLEPETEYRLNFYYYYNMNEGETAPTYTMDVETYTYLRTTDSEEIPTEVPTTDNGTGGTETPTTNGGITPRPPLDESINTFLDDWDTGGIFRILLMVGLVVGVAITLMGVKVHFLIMILLEFLVIMIFFILGWIPSWIIILMGIILFITFITSLSRVRKY
jgi:Ca2+-binding EF-hand superfamily protein